MTSMSLKEQYGWWGKWRRRSWRSPLASSSSHRAALEGLCQLCHRAMRSGQHTQYVQAGFWEAATRVSTTFLNRAFITTLTTLSRCQDLGPDKLYRDR